ncbi:hypothetical protein H8959_000683, partial [Pygathrix nigripes]
EYQLHVHLAYSAPIKFNGPPSRQKDKNRTHQDNEFSSNYSGTMKNGSIISEITTERDEDIAYAIPKRYIKQDIGNMN